MINIRTLCAGSYCVVVSIAFIVFGIHASDEIPTARVRLPANHLIAPDDLSVGKERNRDSVLGQYVKSTIDAGSKVTKENAISEPLLTAKKGFVLVVGSLAGDLVKDRQVDANSEVRLCVGKRSLGSDDNERPSIKTIICTDRHASTNAASCAAIVELNAKWLFSGSAFAFPPATGVSGTEVFVVKKISETCE